ncbi:SCAN domain-containing protein 3-like [Palaemon carinicauda]|uniref:SCAN domain-containing protein 3-like n=1 Tax=Palaemon carinicauda TaxID=392227 RepID=UPI0035B67CFB
MATSVTKIRKYSKESISCGFTSILADGIEKPQCVLCFKVLGNDSMRPSKLKHHLLTIHPQYAEKDPDFFRCHESSLEQQKMDATEFEEEEGNLVRNPFSGTLDITTIPSDVQDEFLDLKHDSAAKDLYEEKSLNVFWCSVHQSYPKCFDPVFLDPCCSVTYHKPAEFKFKVT